jgi:hypothetical protein
MRIQLDLDDYGIEMVDELKRLTGSRTYKDLFNNAMSLLDWAVRQRMHGNTISSIDSGTGPSKELVMPALQHAAMLASRDRVSTEEVPADPAGEALRFSGR